jgi:hypothetical protein
MMGASLAFRSDIFIVSWWTRPDISSSVAPLRSSRLAFSVATYIHKLQASVADVLGLLDPDPDPLVRGTDPRILLRQA